MNKKKNYINFIQLSILCDYMKILILLIGFLFCFNSNATEIENLFYVSLRSDEVNLRNGPGNEYPIKYVYQLKDMPLKVIGEYDNWYKVKDKDNDEGWVNKNLTSKKRTMIIVNGTQIMYKKDNTKSNPIFRLEENVVVKYDKCNQNWCKIEINNKTGWVQSQNVWGHEK